MIVPVFRRRISALRGLSASILGVALATTLAATASQAAGTGMPWEAPLQSVLDSIQGPVAKIMAVIVIIATGLALAFGENSGGFRRLIQIVFGLSIAFAASSFFLSFTGLSTNLVITTDRRIYYVALTSTSGTAMAALFWTYPADQLIALRKAAEKAEAAAPVASGLDVTALHFNYAISGDPAAWRPLRAFDDGRQTFIEFSADIATGEAPPLFLVDGKGTAQLVNYRVKGRFYVIDRQFDVAELRLGLKHQQVVRIARVQDAPARRAS